ncbi:TetR/AcrR family transcriptional regulator [Novosphingobium umbonatum]|uniref:TetR/AcrR family transcriptional regulator n=1 Tax=Novosphingobium umbonatum TaxID=1908524 RepID=A0A437N710_9SPHN|nr:TetR/AcrR family transcriptional regulator [Novosphingobium umbonatum]RVU05700.1 TetR/AcrR family transcriptional regulator [Novosphingobium umbonatum]
MTSRPIDPDTAPAQAAGPKRRANGVARRKLIMDAAERIFAERGYFGSTMREVSQESGAALGVIHHHFPSKGQLFAEVVERKRERLLAIIRDSLDKVEAGPQAAQGTIEAFLGPFFRICADNRHEFRDYIVLTSHFMSHYGQAEVGDALGKLLPISHLFMERLGQTAPAMSKAHLQMATYLIEAALVFMVQDTGFLDSMSGGDLSKANLDALIEEASVFFAGGVQALAAAPA